MAVLLADGIAGPYDITWNSTAIGLTNEDGIRHITSFREQPVTSSKYGQMEIDDIYLGQVVTVTFTLVSWNANMRSFLNPYGATLGAPGVVGRIGSALAQVMVCTALTGAPSAAALGPAVRTYHLAKISNARDVEYAMNANLREIPVAVKIYPTDQSGVTRFFTDT